MVKYYLKNTDKEVKVGNTIEISIPGRTPYGEGKCEVKVLVTQATLSQLVKDGIVEAKDDLVANLNEEMYRPYVRRLARKCKLSFGEACEMLDTLLNVSPYAHVCLLLELIAEVSNRDKEPHSASYIVDPATRRVSVISTEGNAFGPRFITADDARKASELIKPFILDAQREKREQKD